MDRRDNGQPLHADGQSEVTRHPRRGENSERPAPHLKCGAEAGTKNGMISTAQN